MIRQAHLCAALSLLLAAVATLLLYQPEGARTPDTTDEPAPIIADRVPELTPTAPWIEPDASSPPQPKQNAASTTIVSAAGHAPAPPRQAFATVAAGERLEDVARRVYGTADAADRLWRANRDTLNRPETPLEPGTLLRTP